jgi:hypothetical protein
VSRIVLAGSQSETVWDKTTLDDAEPNGGVADARCTALLWIAVPGVAP